MGSQLMRRDSCQASGKNLASSAAKSLRSSAARRSPGPSNQGSGFFISSDGYAITTNHVVEHGTSIEIETGDGEKYPAKLVGSDPESDLAFIKVQGSGFSFVEFADEAPRIGEWVMPSAILSGLAAP
jgi:S1-C subfamily serine protease